MLTLPDAISVGGKDRSSSFSLGPQKEDDGETETETATETDSGFGEIHPEP